MDTGRKIYLFFAFVILVLFFVVIGRFYYLQVVKHADRMDKIENSVEFSVVRGKRGTIYDRNGNPLAMSEVKVSIAVDPAGVVNKEFLADIISENLGMNRQEVLEILRKNKKRNGRSNHYEVLKQDVDYGEYKALKNAVNEAKNKESRISKSVAKGSQEKKQADELLSDLNRIIYEKSFKRVYPQGKLLANVLGFVQANKNPTEEGPEGLEGIELRYDSMLAGAKVQVKQNKLTKKRIYEDDIDIESEIGDSKKGSDIYLTIDSEIQFIAEEELAKMVEKVHAKWGGVVIMEPYSGKILAMANYPTYEPERYREYPIENKRNFAVSDLFEPGSTFKSFSILAVLNENLAKPGELVYGENGSFIFGKKLVRDSHPNQWMTIRDVVVNSSNIGTIKFADRLTNEQLYNYFTMFGFGQKSGINIPGESNKPIRDYKKWYPIDKGNLSFGQGLSVNMVQLARAYSAIYNGGVLWKPVLVDKIVGKNSEKVFIPEPRRINFEYKSDKKIIEMLEGVVSDEHGTAKRARLKGVEVGGKTGTSQIYDPALKKYSWNRVVCSFAGAVPNNDPKFVMVVVIDEPKGKEYGGTVAAPVFKEIAERALPKFDVFVYKSEKDKDKIPEYVTTDMTGSVIDLDDSEIASEIGSDYVKIPNFRNVGSNDALAIANDKNLEVVFIGNPINNRKIVGQSPKAGEVVLAGTVVSLDVEEEKKNEND
jgi:cell division protein FtsI (penicillin-binding protein 3)